MNVNLFGKSVQIRDFHCTKNNCERHKVDTPYLNMYVRVTNVCQANCGFCAYHGEETPFDLYKLLYIISELTRKLKLSKLSCTGGEPTMQIAMVKEILSKTKEISPQTFTVVNTNGYRLWDLHNFKDVDSIALSRHHYLDSRNTAIFGTDNVASIPDIGDFSNKKVLRLSCNLIRGEIDSEREVINYLNNMAVLGVRDVGFVTLMSANKYAEQHKVEFADFDFSGCSDMINNQNWNNKDWCRCSNYLYSPPAVPAIMQVYARQTLKPMESEGNLVYDGQYLRTKFGGEIII